MFFLAMLRKNDLNSKFMLYFRLAFIKNLMSCVRFEFSRLSHYLVIKVLYFFALWQISFDILSYGFTSVNNFLSFSKQNQRRNRDLNPGAATNDLLPFQGSPFSLLGISPRLTHKPYKAEKVGFEPTVPFRITGFQDRLFKPLRHLSSDCLQLRQLN